MVIRGVVSALAILCLLILISSSVSSANFQTFNFLSFNKDFSSKIFLSNDFNAKSVFVTENNFNSVDNNPLIFSPEKSSTTYNAGAIWVTKNACGIQGLDATIFNSGENVYINGENIDQGSYSWRVEGQQGESCDSGQIVASGIVSVGYFKKFCFKAYTVNENDGGQYNIKIGGIKRDEYRVDKLCTTCGNGIINQGEQCDDGNTNNTDSCNNQCQINVCIPKTCYDLGKVCGQWSNGCGGTLNCGPINVSCSSTFGTCDVNGIKSCVNGTGYGLCNAVDPRPGNCQGLECGSDLCGGSCGTCASGESCEQGMCIPLPYCGNGIIESGEQCDDGLDNGQICVPSYGGFCFYCTSQCDLTEIPGPECGDGILNLPHEECDDGNTNNDDTCNNQCDINPYCGDGDINQDWEECDDGNIRSGDGCDAECFLEGCKNNSDCGTDFYSNNYCVEDDVARNKTVFICNNPSTVNAYCSNYTTTNVTGQCDYGCSNGVCDECIPKTCYDLGKVCGQWSNGCGGILNCGPINVSCSSTFGTCDVNGIKSCVNGTGYGLCNAVDPRPGNCQGLECGSNLCGGVCGVCPYGESCEQGMCVPESFCGDGQVDSGEECDQGALNGNVCTPEYDDFCVYCSESCELEKVKGPECGDGILNTSHEQCDDGNLVNGDGCSNICEIEEQECDYECLTASSLSDITRETIKASGEKTLQQLLNEKGYALNVTSEQTNIQTWQANQNVVLEIEYLGAIASFPHTFGYYLDHNISTFVPLFENNGDDLSINTTHFVVGDKMNISIPSGHVIGYAMHTYAGTNPYNASSIFYYTENTFNPSGKDQAVVFDLCDEFVIAFDDTYGDKDYQDLVVSVKRLSCGEELPYCGNGIIESGEQCDDGLDNGQICVPSYGGFCFYCTSQCDLTEIPGSECGDGILNLPHEECDDGNLVDGDGCSMNCNFEETICEHDVGVRYSYGNSLGTGIGIKYAQNTTFILFDPAQLSQDNNYTIRSLIDNHIDEINNIRVIVKLNNTLLANYTSVINNSHTSNTNLITSQFSPGAYKITLDVSKVNEVDCNLSDNHAERWIIIEEGEELPYCGNGIVEPGEQCDDGNTNNTDSCNNQCQTNVCVPKTCQELGKVCGQWSNGCGGTLNCGPINVSCSSTFGTCDVNGTKSCVNGTGYGLCNAVDPRTPEICDELDNDCDGIIDEYLQCNEPECGNGIVEGDEECDDGNNVNDDMCTNDCISPPYCGDGLMNQEWEECDDGNIHSGDGCDAECFNETQECIPKTCQQLGKECGSWNNGCNATINCGSSYKTCDVDYGTCTEYGREYCDNGQYTGICLETHDPRTQEVCNGIDDDCDGKIDEYLQCEICEDRDSDHDGVNDCDDLCPNSKPGEEVDENGCDIFQFCEGNSCGFNCFEADWMNNEEERFPHDCTVVIVLRNGKVQQPKCVPTVFSNQCAG